jgi:hypothetical protein
VSVPVRHQELAHHFSPPAKIGLCHSLLKSHGKNFMPPAGSAALCDLLMTRDENIMRIYNVIRWTSFDGSLFDFL